MNMNWLRKNRAIYIFLLIMHSCSIICMNKLNIAIYFPPNESLGYWDQYTINKEISGAEKAVVELAKELATLNCKVYVYSNPSPDSKVVSINHNPHYKKYTEIDWENIANNIDIFIIWRMPEFLKMPIDNLSYRKKKPLIYFWPVDPTGSINEETINKLKNVFWSSNTQKELWCKDNPGLLKFKDIIGYGVDLSLFNKKIKDRKNKYSCIYASSYVRGLPILLNCWPQIKKEFPKAELNIYFGTRSWSPYQDKMKDQLQQLKALGVKEHGWISDEDIIKAYERNSFWAYPCIYEEMFCISGLKAQIAGCIPVIYNTAALKDTVKFGYIADSSKSYLELLRQAFRDANKISTKTRKKCSKKVIETGSWDYIGNKLIKIFSKDIKN